MEPIVRDQREVFYTVITIDHGKPLSAESVRALSVAISKDKNIYMRVIQTTCNGQISYSPEIRIEDRRNEMV